MAYRITHPFYNMSARPDVVVTEAFENQVGRERERHCYLTAGPYGWTAWSDPPTPVCCRDCQGEANLQMPSTPAPLAIKSSIRHSCRLTNRGRVAKQLKPQVSKHPFGVT
jgi:hypothetical protein